MVTKWQIKYLYNIIALRNQAAKILASMMLLLTFIIGQVIVFEHSHNAYHHSAKHFSSQTNKSTITEVNCPICAQHGKVQLILQQVSFHFWAVINPYTPIAYTVIYQSIKLLLSGNRGPPAL